MSDERIPSQGIDRQRHLVEMLARETEAPIDTVEQMYAVESAKLECVARIKTYVPVLATRRVKMQLRSGH